MSDATAILARIHDCGLTIGRDGDELVLTGNTAALTPTLRARIVAAKAELLALLRDTRDAPAYPCWKPGCDGTAPGPWRRVGPDCWQADCSGGHIIQRAAISFELEHR